MEVKNAKLIYYLTEEIHKDVDAIYEALVDKEFSEGSKLIEETRKKLKDLKDNIVKNEN